MTVVVVAAEIVAARVKKGCDGRGCACSGCNSGGCDGRNRVFSTFSKAPNEGGGRGGATEEALFVLSSVVGPPVVGPVVGPVVSPRWGQWWRQWQWQIFRGPEQGLHITLFFSPTRTELSCIKQSDLK